MRVDLHGMTEIEATSAILCALIPLDDNEVDEVEIITGNGYVIKRVLLEILEEGGYGYSQSSHNHGSFVVYRF